MKKDVLYPFILCALIGLVVGLNYYTFGNFLYDCGREFLAAEAVSKGSAPIKDIFISYFPLSYQINGVLFKIFGANLDVLRGMGVLSSFVMTVFIYFCAREFLPPNRSFVVTVISTFLTMFNVSYLYNYVMGYSYAFIYGASLFFVSLFFALKFLKEDKFLYPAYFTLGLCLALKAEFIFLIIPYFLLLIYKKVPLKKIILALVLYFAPLFLSLALTFGNLGEYFSFLNRFMNSDILKFYNSNVFITNPINWIMKNFESFRLFVLGLLPCLIILYFPLKYNKKPLYYSLLALLFVLGFIFSILSGKFSPVAFFSFLCIPSFFIFCYSIKKRDIPLALLAACQLFLAFRFNFIYSGAFLSYIMPPALLVNCIFFYKKGRIIVAFLLILSLINVCYFTLSQKLFAKFEIKTDKGKMLLYEKQNADTINKALDFLTGIEKDKTVLVLPEGGMFNFLADKKTDLKYYQLLPNHIEVLGEENIISGLQKARADYIIITNTDYSIYGTPEFCKDFGRKICGYIYEEYDYTGTIGQAPGLALQVFRARKF